MHRGDGSERSPSNMKASPTNTRATKPFFNKRKTRHTYHVHTQRTSASQNWKRKPNANERNYYTAVHISPPSEPKKRAQKHLKGTNETNTGM